MGMRVGCCTAAALALLSAPVAQADRAMSVGYRTPSALHGVPVARAPARREVGRRRSAAHLRTTRRHAAVRAASTAVPRRVDDCGASTTRAPICRAARHSPCRTSIRLTYNVDQRLDRRRRHRSVTERSSHRSPRASAAAAHLMVVQANRGATFSDVDEAAGIVWAVDHGARIVNLSLSGSQTSATERAAVRYATKKGVLLVAAAGNGGQSGNRASYPAALLGRDGLVVGASTPTGDARALLDHRPLRRPARARRRRARRHSPPSAPNTLFALATGNGRLRPRLRHLVRGARSGGRGGARLGGEPAAQRDRRSRRSSTSTASGARRLVDRARLRHARRRRCRRRRRSPPSLHARGDSTVRHRR